MITHAELDIDAIIQACDKTKGCALGSNSVCDMCICQNRQALLVAAVKKAYDEDRA